MSVEGDRIVVVWRNNTSNLRSDIYYSVSKDNGRRWTGPALLTDPNGPSAEHPKVALFRGLIHLFYSQNGNLIYRQQPFPAK